MLQTNSKKMILCVVTLLTFGLSAQAQDTAESTPAPAPAPAPTSAPSTETTTSTEPVKALTLDQLIQRKYKLTDAQMQTLSAAKLPEPQSVRVAHLAQLSGKSIEEVLKLRNEDKLGWGQIAKQLGVSESELGKAVSSLRKERNEERKREQTEKRRLEKEERLKKQEEKRKEREDKRKQAQEQRQQKKQERQDKSQGRGRNK